MGAKPRAGCSWVPPNCSSEAQEISSSLEPDRSSCKHSLDNEVVSSSTRKVSVRVCPRVAPMAERCTSEGQASSRVSPLGPGSDSCASESHVSSSKRGACNSFHDKAGCSRLTGWAKRATPDYLFGTPKNPSC
eukprot:5455643-Amphidinium_carterae.1